MRKRIKTTAGMLFLGLLCVSGTYGYFSDTLQVVNHISVGDIKISMEEYKRYLKDYDYFDKKKFVKNRKEKYETD